MQFLEYNIKDKKLAKSRALLRISRSNQNMSFLAIGVFGTYFECLPGARKTQRFGLRRN